MALRRCSSQLAASRTRARISSIGHSRRDPRARQDGVEIADDERDFGVGFGAGIVGRGQRAASASASIRCGLKRGMLADRSETDSDRLPATRTNGRTRTISRLPARLVVETRMTWRAEVDSPGGGIRSALRATATDRGVDRAAQRSFDPFGQRREIGFAVERCENGAAHQGRAAQAGQDRAAEPLNRDAAAIDQMAGAPSTDSGASLPRSMNSASALGR